MEEKLSREIVYEILPAYVVTLLIALCSFYNSSIIKKISLLFGTNVKPRSSVMESQLTTRKQGQASRSN